MKQEDLNKILDSLGDKAYSKIRSWLFGKANNFAVNKEPDKAVKLHRICNSLADIIKEVEPDYFKM